MKRVLLIVAWMLGTTLLASAQTSFYYPHVVDGVLGATDPDLAVPLASIFE